MQFESNISLLDLKVILNNAILNQRPSMTIKRRGGDMIDVYRIIDYDEAAESVTFVYREKYTPVTLEIPVTDIEWVEFESFFTYRGVSARIFVVE